MPDEPRGEGLIADLLRAEAAAVEKVNELKGAVRKAQKWLDDRRADLATARKIAARLNEAGRVEKGPNENGEA